MRPAELRAQSSGRSSAFCFPLGRRNGVQVIADGVLTGVAGGVPWLASPPLTRRPHGAAR
eukprot:scaffold129355_cov63-Phaeocystis_antarctica.AAC.2